MQIYTATNKLTTDLTVKHTSTIHNPPKPRTGLSTKTSDTIAQNQTATTTHPRPDITPWPHSVTTNPLPTTCNLQPLPGQRQNQLPRLPGNFVTALSLTNTPPTTYITHICATETTPVPRAEHNYSPPPNDTNRTTFTNTFTYSHHTLNINTPTHIPENINTHTTTPQPQHPPPICTTINPYNRNNNNISY